MLILRYLLLFLCFNSLKAQSVPMVDSFKITVVNYQQLQEQYFDIQSDSTIIINFWASWCMPCRLEMPYFEQLRKEFSNKKLKIVLATIDLNKHIETKVKPFLMENHIQSEVIAFQDKVPPIQLFPLICPNWSGSIPLTVIMNKTDGTYFETSFDSYEKMKEAFLPYLK
jgi:thiol-disulfide isomerase/thioredoxin